MALLDMQSPQTMIHFTKNSQIQKFFQPSWNLQLIAVINLAMYEKLGTYFGIKVANKPCFLAMALITSRV